LPGQIAQADQWLFSGGGTLFMSRFSMLALLAVALAIPTLICWSNYSLSAQGKDAPPNALKWEYKKVYEVRFEKNQPVSIGERVWCAPCAGPVT
jgi:hypothetical protein